MSCVRALWHLLHYTMVGVFGMEVAYELWLETTRYDHPVWLWLESFIFMFRAAKLVVIFTVI